jgi:hypothetical protein
MRLRRQAEKDASTLTFKIGNVVVTLTDLAPGTDREALQKDIIASLPPDYITKADMLELPEGAEPVHTVVNC